MKKILSHSGYFWAIIIFLAVFFSISFSYFISNENDTAYKKLTIEEHSFNPNDNYAFPNINVKLEPENKFIVFISKKENALIAFLLFYSVCLSILFTYREKSRITKEILDEKIQIEKDRAKSKIDVYENIEKELMKYKDILLPEMNIENLDKKLVSEVNYLLFSARVVLEKVLSKIGFEEGFKEETLNDLIFILYKNKILTPQANGYAHTIKAFGNRVAHPNFNEPLNFNTKDALLVLSTLVAFLNLLDFKYAA